MDGLTFEELCKKYGIGLTGGIACGKSTVAKNLSDKGFIVIDADALSRQAVEPRSKGLAKIVEHFGGGVLSESGELNRKVLSEIIFSHPQQRQSLETFLHPIIRDLLEQQLRSLGLFEQPRIWFYEASLLFEVGKQADFRQIWTVYCPEQIQKKRLMERDGVSSAQADQMISSQWPIQKKLEGADVVIDTSEPKAQLQEKINLALDRLPGRSGIAKFGFHSP